MHYKLKATLLREGPFARNLCARQRLVIEPRAAEGPATAEPQTATKASYAQGCHAPPAFGHGALAGPFGVLHAACMSYCCVLLGVRRRGPWMGGRRRQRWHPLRPALAMRCTSPCSRWAAPASRPTRFGGCTELVHAQEYGEAIG